MGFKQASVLGEDSWFTSLITSGGLLFGDPIFALLLNNPDAELIIGGTDKSKFVGELTYYNVDRDAVISKTTDFFQTFWHF